MTIKGDFVVAGTGSRSLRTADRLRPGRRPPHRPHPPQEGSVSKTYTEWRVTGDPGEMLPGVDWPPYEQVCPEGEARDFIRMVNEGGGWRNGPHLHKRTVTVTDWEDA